LTGIPLCGVCSCHEILRAQRTRVVSDAEIESVECGVQVSAEHKAAAWQAVIEAANLVVHAVDEPVLAANLGAAAVASFEAALLTEIYLRSVCSCQEILRRNGRG
jgi:hypothetical protein